MTRDRYIPCLHWCLVCTASAGRPRCRCLPCWNIRNSSERFGRGDCCRLYVRQYCMSYLHLRDRARIPLPARAPVSQPSFPVFSVSSLDPSLFFIVRQAPIPAVCATPPTDSIPNQQVELNDALRRLGVTFNVSVEEGETQKAAGESATGPEGGFHSSPAAAAASRKMATLPSPARPRQTATSVVSQKSVGLDRSSSFTTPVGFRVS